MAINAKSRALAFSDDVKDIHPKWTNRQLNALSVLLANLTSEGLNLDESRNKAKTNLDITH